MTTVRRSSREKRKTSSIYDEAKKLVEARKSLLAMARRKRKDSDEEDDEEEEESDSGKVTDSGEHSSSDDDDDSDVDVVVPPKPQLNNNKSPKPQLNNNKSPDVPKTKQTKTRKVTVKMGKKKEDTEKARTTSNAPKGDGSAKIRTAVVRSLGVLEKRIRSLWEEGELASQKSKEEDKSLVFNLLDAAKKSQRTNVGVNPLLEETAREIIVEHKSDATKAQIKLVNLLFRSVGGSPATDLNEEDDLNLNDEDWEEAVTNLVEEMRHTPENAILLCADPQGAVHAATEESTPASLAVHEYRKIYEEFWYVLGRVALSEGIQVKSKKSIDESDDDDDESPPRSSLFEVELVREIVVRMSELVTVGQPDIRAAATIAVLQLGVAALERTVTLGTKLDVATRQFNAANTGKKQMKRKSEGLRLQINSLKRSCAELEEIVAGLLFQGVFLNRYRDSNMHIRAFSLQWLSRLTILRPDFFLMDKYLKYLGWMMSDKAPCVRQASISGLLAPFNVANSVSATGGGRNAPTTTARIDLSAMENVVKKFLPRVVDCVIDVDIRVQECAMELLLALVRGELLNDCDDDNIWNQVNLRALDTTTSSAVRRNALYFVMEQLDSFNVDDGVNTKASLLSEKVKAERLDSIATWVAHNLSDSDIPPERMKIELADLAVQALLEMPEHKGLITDWTVILRAIKGVAEANSTNNKDVRRVESTKQRVLLQMLACAANSEVHSVSNIDFMASDADEDVFTARTHREESINKKKGKSKDPNNAHELLSAALVSALSEFLTSFKGDVTVLKSLTALPRCLLPSVFSLPDHKDDFLAMIKHLSNMYLEVSHDQVLENIARSLVFFARGDHARVAEAKMELRDLITSLRERLLQLVSDSGKELPSVERRDPAESTGSDQSTDSITSDQEKKSAGVDNEHAIATCLKRFRVLSKRCNLAGFIEFAPDDMNDGISIEKLCVIVSEIAKTRLAERRISSEGVTSEPTIPSIWTSGNPRVHGLVASSVNEALSLLLSIVAWQTSFAVDQEKGVLEVDELEDVEVPDIDDSEDLDDHIVLRLRGILVELLDQCWDQRLDGFDLGFFKEDHIKFVDSVQQQACRITGDLRSLFPKEWTDSPSPLLRAFALTEDRPLIAGSVMYLQSKEDEFRLTGDESGLARNLLLPLCRGLTPNWLVGNRREAGVVLTHIIGSGHEASEIVTTMSRVLKKIEPLRLLEAHMACLQQSFEGWLQSEPEELESDRPSEEEMQAFEVAERQHLNKFENMVEQADRLSKSLGVGKLSDPKLSPAMLEFVKEGIRFAFSSNDELALGSRLDFLSLIGRYGIWIRRNQSQRKVVDAFLASREAELAEHPEFETLSKENLDAIDAFKELLEIKSSSKVESASKMPPEKSLLSPKIENEDQSRVSPSPGPSAASFRRRMSNNSSVSSKRSRISAQSSLSPLYEGDDAEEEAEDDDDLAPLSSKKRKLAEPSGSPSFGSIFTASTLGKTHTTIDEGSGENSDSSRE